MGFKKVETGGRGSTAQAKISLRKSGSIGINNTALDEYFSEDDEYVVLYFDDEERMLGIQGIDEETDDSFALSRSESGASVTPMSFLRSADLIPKVTTQYSPETQKHEDTELVVVDLDDPIGTYGSPDDESE
jgi:hypothetical protein